MSFSNCNRILPFVFIILFETGCNESNEINYEWHTIEVTATAYNSLKAQTDSDPNITAFGDSLYPGLRCIAVSRDLLNLGLKHNTLVIIEGLEGAYLVKDKMHRRWRNRKDIYMGTDVKAARQWGKKKVSIQYRIKKPIDSPN